MILTLIANQESGVSGNNLRAIRESRGLSQAELARRVGVSKPVISRLEGGKTRLAQHHIEKLTPVLGCRPEDLVSDGLPMTEGERQDLDLLRSLTPESRQRIIELARLLRRAEGSPDEDSSA